MKAYLAQISISNGGVPKLAVPAARITIHGVDGDQHRNKELHGGPERAVCVFSQDRIDALRAEGHGIYPGAAGENFTIAGVDWNAVKPGVRLTVGAVRLEIMSYTPPCQLQVCWFKDGNIALISEKHNPGWSRVYAKVLTEGVVKTGDPVAIEP